MSDQNRSLSNSTSHAAFSLATCQVTLNQKYFDLLNGTDTPNLHLIEIGIDGVAEPVGFARFNVSGAGAASVSGMIPNNETMKDHAILLIVRVDSGTVTFLNENALSEPQNRFIIGADFPAAAGTVLMFLYLPDFERWGMLLHNP